MTRGFRKLLTAQLSVLLLMPALAVAGKGISKEALQELEEAGVNKYLGRFTPVSSEDVGDGWTKHSFDSEGGGGPICIDGSDYSVFTRKGQDKKKLLIFLQGGGACWQGLYRCNESTPSQEPPAGRQGIWDFENKDNPLARHNIVYMPYCDGSVFGGDNRVIDPDFDSASGVDGVRHHRGLRNLSAGMDVARKEFKRAKRIVISGSSAGGVGATAFAHPLVRFQWGNNLKSLAILNDAGPIVINLDAQDAMAARQSDWRFDQFYPASCTDCNAFAQQTPIIYWRLEHDNQVREAFYETDGDATNIGFASVNLPGFFDPLPPLVPPPAGLSQLQYRELILSEHGPINSAYPDRYRRFIVSGDDSHTALQSDLLYSQQVNGVFLHRWARDFVNNKKSWWDLVQDFVPLPDA